MSIDATSGKLLGQGGAAPGRTWDDASTPAARLRVKRFVADWGKSPRGHRPDPLRYLDGTGPGERLAILRADLGLRWEDGDHAGAQWYRDRVDGLTEDAVVALIYEEFCLRELDGEAPTSAAFLERFADVAGPLRKVLEIHDLVGSGRSTTASFDGSTASRTESPFPEAGQTIAGFELVEELGRGGFARVFRARERDLADRSVALKVALNGSREPQTLARLQHTHIVPVYSHQSDPDSGLHLLCMPYFGRVTLAHVLADEGVRRARTGAEIVAALDRLDGDPAPVSARPAGRRSLSSRPYARAIAWWGARLAEALQHAHDRGVLHRDIKPSNVLVTSDGMPMLLDFNLAHETLDDPEAGAATLGGTIPYMSPEHLEALADGQPGTVDGRSDIYALGLVLYEAMGEKAFGPPPASRSMRESILRAAEERRNHPPDLARTFPEAPPALAAVVARCLAGDPEARYANPAELAADLQAVADDEPLRYAREPVLERVWGAVRRHRRGLVVAAPVLLAAALAVFLLFRARADRERDQESLINARGLMVEADALFHRDQFGPAAERYETFANFARTVPVLVRLEREARHKAFAARQTEKLYADTDALFQKADALRLHLLGIDGDRPGPKPDLDAALAPFFVRQNPNWSERGELAPLNPERRARLVRDITELLFLHALRLARADRPDAWHDVLAVCDIAGETRRNPGPWKFLRDLAAAKKAGKPPAAWQFPAPARLNDPWECYQWGRLCLLLDANQPKRAIPWLQRAANLSREQFWLEFDVAYQEDRAGAIDAALDHYNATIDLRPQFPRALINRARLRTRKGAWGWARDDLHQALEAATQDARSDHRQATGLLFDTIYLELGRVHQELGEQSDARRCYQAVLRSPSAGKLATAARQNLGKLNFETGRVAESLAAFQSLIDQDPRDTAALLSRALILLSRGDLNAAEQDLGRVLEIDPADADAWAAHARALLALGQPEDAVAAAERSLTLKPTPGRDRLMSRCVLAVGRPGQLWLDDPAEIRRLPVGGPALVADLQDAANALDLAAPVPANIATRAAILAALGHSGAEAEARRAVAADPGLPRSRLILARILHDRGDRRAALAEVIKGLKIEPDDPRMMILRGRLLGELGQYREALAILDRVDRLGGSTSLFRDRAEVSFQLGRFEEAIQDWNRAVGHDPDDPLAVLGRARTFLRLGQIDVALADLERATELAPNRPDVLAQVAWMHLRLVGDRPGQGGRAAAILGKCVRVVLASSRGA